MVKSDGFVPNDGSDSDGVEVAKTQASTMQERVRLRSLPGIRKLLSFFASFKRTVVQLVASKLSIMTGQLVEA